MTSDDELSPGNERTHCRKEANDLSSINLLFIPQMCAGKAHVPAAVCIVM